MDQLWLIPAFPFIGFLLLTFLPLVLESVNTRFFAIIGAGSVGMAALLTLVTAFEFLNSPLIVYEKTLWQWMHVGTFSVNFGFYLDALSLTMLGVITGVGFLIHTYAAGFMQDDPDYARFFSYMNLFVAAMIVLVLADNLVLLYLGWEGVGLCSYLLIGFWYQNPHNGYCARKAFVITRVGDTALAIGLFLLFAQLDSLHIQSINILATEQWSTGSPLAVITALLILGGAAGKSAQLPLQTWLPDAMAGPTPISALIHAATMVTAGVYLIARTHPLFILAPSVQILVAVIGAVTLLMAACTALMQTDIKRILAYSTISQIGYMFLALGVGAWSGAIYHLVTHAFFKALLFLAAGTIILSLHHEHNIFKMGAMRRHLPLAFVCFLIGSSALAALPFTSGYFSKHDIMLAVWNMPDWGPVLWLTALFGAALTAIYSFRLIFIVFFGEQSGGHSHVHENREPIMAIPLGILCVLALAGGVLSPDLSQVLPQSITYETPLSVNSVTILVPFIAIAISYLLYGRNMTEYFSTGFWGRSVQQLCFNGWGFDWLYHRCFTIPWKTIARINRKDSIDLIYLSIAYANRMAYILASLLQTGNLRWYASSLALGAVALMSYGLFY